MIDDPTHSLSPSDHLSSQHAETTSLTSTASSLEYLEDDPGDNILWERQGRRACSKEALAVFNILTQPIWVFDVFRKSMWWANSAAVRLWNANSMEELLARDFTDMSASTQQRLHEYCTLFVAQDKKITEQWTYYPNEQAVTCNVTVSGLYVEGGRLVMLNEAHVVSKSTLDERCLRGVEMLRHLPVPVGQFDANGQIMDQNPESLKLFGVSSCDGPCNTLNCSLIERFVDQELARRTFDQVLHEGKDFDGEVQQKTLKGLRSCAVQLRRSHDPVTGEPIVLYSARDITAVVRAKKEADQANAAKTEFLAVMAHELRTPLHQVIGFLELMSGTVMTAQQAEYVNLMENSAISLMTVINDLLDFTKLEAGKMKFENIPMIVQDIVSGCISAVSVKAEEKGLELTSHLGDVIPPIVGDPNRLRQVLLNFLHNAVKFTHSGSIHLSLSRLPDDDQGRVNLKFVVADTGIGVAPNQCEHIFQKYQQADASISRNYGGTGLGLSICKILVESLGGEIGVSSVVGKGSKFWFVLPYRVATTLDTMGTSVKGCPSDYGKALTILVAEDNKVNQKLVVALLNRLGHRSFVVETGLQAVEEVARRHFDLILMDIQMPEMDGLEATKAIRRNGFSQEILPILGLTADYRTSEQDYYIGLGMNACLGKPIRLQDLRNSIRNAVENIGILMMPM